MALLPLKSIAEEAPPEGDFLEYLGQMVEEDGEFLDLLDLAEVEDMPEEEASAEKAKDAETSTETGEVSP